VTKLNGKSKNSILSFPNRRGSHLKILRQNLALIELGTLNLLLTKKILNLHHMVQNPTAAIVANTFYFQSKSLTLKAASNNIQNISCVWECRTKEAPAQN
jgi:hypothetical protein